MLLRVDRLLRHLLDCLFFEWLLDRRRLLSLPVLLSTGRLLRHLLDGELFLRLLLLSYLHFLSFLFSDLLSCLLGRLLYLRRFFSLLGTLGLGRLRRRLLDGDLLLRLLLLSYLFGGDLLLRYLLGSELLFRFLFLRYLLLLRLLLSDLLRCLLGRLLYLRRLYRLLGILCRGRLLRPLFFHLLLLGAMLLHLRFGDLLDCGRFLSLLVL